MADRLQYGTHGVPRSRTPGDPYRVLVFSGSPRLDTNCAGQISKTYHLAKHAAQNAPEGIETELIDLANRQEQIIYPCNGCVSTSKFLCQWPCVAEGERVITNAGLHAIEQIKAGDRLPSGAVMRQWMSSPEEDIYEVAISDGRRVRLTANHPVKVRRLVKRETAGRVYSHEWIQVGDLKPGDAVPFPLGGGFAEKQEPCLGLALAAGLLWGDGTWAADSPLWYVHQSESAHIKDVRGIMPEPVSVRQHSEPGMLVVTWSKAVGRQLVQHFGVTKGPARTRRLPKHIVRDASRDEVIAFLRGWFATDGSVNARKKGAAVQLYNTSFHCLRDAQLLLQKLGVRSSVYEGRGTVRLRGKDIPRTAQLLIVGEAARAFSRVVGFSYGAKQERLERALQVKRKCKNWPGPVGRVRAVRHVGRAPVYDLTVDSSHEFVVEGVPVHNCTCYGPRSRNPQIPDMMYTAGIYHKLEACDAFVIFSPIHWYSTTTPVKAMWDRLVCASLTPTAKWAFDEIGIGKEVKATIDIARSGEHNHQLSNHLAGRVGAFFVHGDGGADDYVDREPPPTYDPASEAKDDVPHEAIMEIVHTCRYMGIDVPDSLIWSGHINEGMPYYETNEKISGRADLFEAATVLMGKVLEYLGGKGT